MNTNDPNPTTPTVFDARAAAARAEQDYPPFRFIGLDGETYQFPHPMMVDMALSRRVQEGEITVEQFLDTVAPDAWAAVQAMPAPVQKELMTQWEGKAQADIEQLTAAGKAPGPSPAPNRAARRSKPTSRSAGSTTTGSASTKRPRSPRPS